jgi:hypothetical protein
MKVNVIGKQKIAERGFVLVELFFIACLFGSVEVFIANIFCLDKADRYFLPGKYIIGCATRLSFWFVGSSYIRYEAFYQWLQVTRKVCSVALACLYRWLMLLMYWSIVIVFPDRFAVSNVI